MPRPLVYQAPYKGVHLRDFLRKGIMPPLQSHNYELLQNKGKLAGEGNLVVLPRRCESLVADRSSRVGQAIGQAPFYSATPPPSSRG
jgi:hypothetical protein